MARVTRAENTARIRVLRLEKAGINNQAAARFRGSLKNIRESGLSAAEKSELREAAAKAFLETERTTLTEIKQAFKEAVSAAPAGSFEAMAENTPDHGLSTAEKSRFLDGTDNQRLAILASHYLSSETILAAYDAAQSRYADAPEAASAAFYYTINNLVSTAYNTPGISEEALNNLIIDWYGD